MVSFLPGNSVAALSGALSLSALSTKSLGFCGGTGATEEKDGWGAAGAVGRADAGCEAPVAEVPADAWAALSPLLVVTTAVATIAATTQVASAPPPISSQRLRRLREADASARAAQSGVPVPEPCQGAWCGAGCCCCCGRGCCAGGAGRSGTCGGRGCAGCPPPG